MWRWAALVVLVALAAADTAGAAVAKPRFVRNIATGETGWFSSPGLVDLTGDKKLEIVAPFYSTFVYSAKGRLLGKGTASKGRVYAPGVVADLDRDGVKEIVVGGNEGTVAAYNLGAGGLQPKAGWPASTCSGGQCPETRGLAAADLDGDGRIEVVATTTNTSSSGSQVFVFTAVRRQRARLAALQRGRRDLQRRRQPRLRGLRGERRDRAARRRPAARGRRHLRQPSDQPLQPRRHVGARVAVVHEPPERPRREAPRLGPVHPLAQAEGRGRPLPPARRRLARREQDAVAAVDGLAAVDRRPRPRRPQRGHRRPQRRTQGAVRDAGLRVHGARRRVRQRIALGPPAQGLQGAPAHAQAGGAPRRRLLPAERHPRPEPRQPHRQPPPRDRRPDPRRLHLRDQPEGQAPVALPDYARGREDLRVRGRRRRPEPRRPARARLRHLRPGAQLRPPRRALRQGQEALRPPPPPPGHERQRHRHPRGTVDRRPQPRRQARDRGHDVRPRHRRLPRPALRTRSRCRGRPAAATSCAPARPHERLGPAEAGPRPDREARLAAQPQPVLLPQLEHV